MGEAVKIFQFDTEYSADSVEWCPIEPNRNVFVCANYQLNAQDSSAENKRVGRILLFSWEDNRNFILKQTIDTEAVLDQKWCHNKINGSSLLGVVFCSSTLRIYKLNSKLLTLEPLTSFIGQAGDVLFLSLDWSTGKHNDSNPKITVSDSNGRIHVFNFNGSALKEEHVWKAHEFESWITAFDYWNPSIVFSGADDSKLKIQDVRTDVQCVSIIKEHTSGVTSLHSNALKEHIFVSGSYDTFCMLWDQRTTKSPICKLKMQTPVWRLKWDPFSWEFIISACMLGGANVIHCNSSDLKAVSSYTEHKDITYGVDWCHMDSEDLCKYEIENESKIVGVCSFYDHLLTVAKIKI